MDCQSFICEFANLYFAFVHFQIAICGFSILGRILQLWFFKFLFDEFDFVVADFLIFIFGFQFFICGVLSVGSIFHLWSINFGDSCKIGVEKFIFSFKTVRKNLVAK